MQFTKMEGAGNDYVYIDARHQEHDWPELSRRMSDRHFGVGSDGLILIADSDVADLKMVMYNADGSQGEMCGNGFAASPSTPLSGTSLHLPAKG